MLLVVVLVDMTVMPALPEDKLLMVDVIVTLVLQEDELLMIVTLVLPENDLPETLIVVTLMPALLEEDHNRGSSLMMVLVVEEGKRGVNTREKLVLRLTVDQMKGQVTSLVERDQTVTK